MLVGDAVVTSTAVSIKSSTSSGRWTNWSTAALYDDGHVSTMIQSNCCCLNNGGKSSPRTWYSTLSMEKFMLYDSSIELHSWSVVFMSLVFSLGDYLADLVTSFCEEWPFANSFMTSMILTTSFEFVSLSSQTQAVSIRQSQDSLALETSIFHGSPA